MKHNKSIIRRKILVLGAYAVGKTSLVNQYTTGMFSEQYLSTIGVNIRNKTIEEETRIINLLIWDIADIVTYQNIPPIYLKGANGLVLVYDLTRKETYDRICSEYQGFLMQVPNLPKVVVGNKLDLAQPERADDNDERSVPIDIYTSAKTGENVDAAFQLMIDYCTQTGQERRIV